MKRVAKMLRRHEDLILDWFPEHGAISQATVEGLNNKAKVTVRNSCGFRTHGGIKTALYQALGDLPRPKQGKEDCRLVRQRAVWRLVDGRAVLVGYSVYRAPGGKGPPMPGVTPRCEYGLEILVVLAVLVYVMLESFDIAFELFDGRIFAVELFFQLLDCAVLALHLSSQFIQIGFPTLQGPLLWNRLFCRVVADGMLD